jgi:transcriptional regulator with PAS, ATPase and Fis domain
VALKQNLAESSSFESMIGRSPAMLQVFKLASKVLNTDTTVMITGETGTGKERLARAIYAASHRKGKLFVAQNCGALTDSLLESELFGHVKGAFTGAVSDKKGLFELAHGGTVFLDEIGDTSPAMQLRLLRVIQEGEIRPVGAQQTRHVDVRIMAATHRNLEEEVREGRFREDLFYRLNVFPLHIPPLRERKEDLPDLVHHFIRTFALKLKKSVQGLSEEAMALFDRAPWPGNIRELENELERAVTLADEGEVIGAEHLSPRFHHPAPLTFQEIGGTLKEQVETLEKRLIQKALDQTQGNILKAAEQLGLSRPGLHKKLDRYHLHP